MKRVTAVLLAAGRGYRFRSKIPKPLARIERQAMIVYSLSVLSRHPRIKEIIVVANKRNSKQIAVHLAQYRIKKVRYIVLGGARRQDSVAHALAVMDASTDLVLIHDAARPFLDKRVVSALIKEALESGAAIAGVPVKATVKRAGLRLDVKETLDRRGLWEIQTPQVFKKELILEAYKKFNHLDVTDDAMLVEKLGKKVRIVMGSYNNIKITTPEDLVIAKAIAKHVL